MAASNRYTGAALVVKLGSITLSADYTKFEFTPQMKTVEKTAANDTDASYNTTYKDGKWQLTSYDIGNTVPAGGSVDLQGTVKVGTTGTLFVYPQGITTGLPYFSFPVIITEAKITVDFDKNVAVDVQGIKNGAMVNDYGSIQ